METVFDSPLFSALIAALVGGLLSLLATWWTLTSEFTHQRMIRDEQQREKLRGAGWALIAEMSDNLASLKMLCQLAQSEAPVSNMLRKLTLNRNSFDVQLPLLALRLQIADLHALTAAYSGVSILFALLEGKWEHLPHPHACSKQDAQALDFATNDFEKALRTVAKTLLTDEERKAAELE